MFDLPNRRPLQSALAGAVALLLAIACGDDVQGPGEEIPDGLSSEFLSALIVSNPVASASALVAGASFSRSSTGAEAVYTSLPPGTFPEGDRALIRTRSTGAESAVLMVNGGFDPIRLAATVGDTIDFRVELGSGGVLEYYSVVPPSRPPVVVRTEPPPKKRDVPLNAVMLVVFSEPIDASALSEGSTQLLLGGVPVAGTLRFADSEQLAVTFVPAEPLTAGADYELLVTQATEDLEGEALAEELRVDFTTATVSPTRVFTQVSAGGSHTCGVTNDDVLYCWGSNIHGELGTGSRAETWRATPVWGDLGFAQVSAGYGRTCGVATDGVAYCWGENGDGRLGDGTEVDRLTPAAVAGGLTFAQVSAGIQLFGWIGGAGVATDGVGYCWPACWGSITLQPAPTVNDLTFTQVSAGNDQACGVTIDNDAYCWGVNFYGEFGDGTIDSVGPRPGETLVAGGLDFAQISAGANYTCGVTTGNLAYCWGKNNGNLGDGTMDDRLVPTTVAGGLSFVHLSTGHNHTCGVTTDNFAYCWGRNGSGELGDGTTEHRLFPTPVAGGLSFAYVSAGPGHTCGITTENNVYCWGRNFNGQLGSQFGYRTLGGHRTFPTPIEPVF